MVLTLLSAVATASAEAGPPGWVITLQNPFIGGIFVAVLVQVLKSLPQVPIAKGPKVAAVASILSVITGAISAYSSGSLVGFDVGAAWTILLSAITTLVTAMGTYEAADQAGKALTTRETPPVP